MTVTSAPPRPPATARRPRWWPRDRRFLRWAVPTAVVVALFVVTGVTAAIEHAAPNDADFLEPAATSALGAHTVAARLERSGVPVHRYGSSRSAIVAAGTGGVTVLVTAPDLMDRDYMGDLAELPSSDRVVLVAPSALLLSGTGLPVRRTGSRWATGVAAPGCRSTLVGDAGRAAVVGTRYRPTGSSGATCYDGGLVQARAGFDGPGLVVVGAADVFRNDRVGEHDNARLAQTLLSGGTDVIWLSLHRQERGYTPPPPPTESPAATDGPTEPYTPPPPADGAQGSGDDQAGSSGSDSQPPNPLWSAFPPWVWAVVAQLLVAAVLLGLWRARRLGAPVTEPLPVLVRATETVSGRARLYQRARARQAALSALRAGTLRRVVPLLDGIAEDDRRHLVPALAERAGWPPERVEAALYGPPPEDDTTLAAAVAELDELVRRVHEEREGTAGARSV